MRIRISELARDDLNLARQFYERQHAGLGDRFLESMIDEIDSLNHYAGIHATLHGYQRLICRRFPYVVYYEIFEDVVSIVGVLDARRDPSWITQRLKR